MRGVLVSNEVIETITHAQQDERANRRNAEDERKNETRNVKYGCLVIFHKKNISHSKPVSQTI